MSVLTVAGLSKQYPAFQLLDVSFDLAPGKITGFIGRNGAGKTTTLQSLINLVHPDSGEIWFFGKPFHENEPEIKARMGFVTGGVNYYPTKKLGTIAKVTSAFYSQWDQATYGQLCKRFALDENKTPAKLSAGMRVKFALALALSHRAELLLLDEPTSGLDPISRDELLDILLSLCEGGATILFSTHITSDLERCADRILYIQNGHIRADEDIKGFAASYRLLRMGPAGPEEGIKNRLIGCKRAKEGFTALIRAADAENLSVATEEARLEDIMIHLEKEGEAC